MSWLRFLSFSVLLHGAIVWLAWQRAGLRQPLELGPLRENAAHAWSGGMIAVTTWSEPQAPAPRSPRPTAADSPEPDLPERRPQEAIRGTKPAPRREPAEPDSVPARREPAPRETSAVGPTLAQGESASERATPSPASASASTHNAEAESTADDWMSPDQQRPASTPSAPPTPAPRRDPWVARLLAAERRQAALRPEERRGPGTPRRTVPPAPADPNAGTTVRGDSAAPRAAARTTAGVVDRAAPRADNAGLPRDLLYAFTFALPRAVEASPLWDELKPGSLGRVRLRVRLTHGRIEASRLLSPPTRAARLIHDKTLVLLRRGQFAIGQRSSRSGRVVLQIDLRLSQQPTRASVTLWNQLPERTSAHFIKPSGRRLDAHVELFE